MDPLKRLSKDNRTTINNDNSNPTVNKPLPHQHQTRNNTSVSQIPISISTTRLTTIRGRLGSSQTPTTPPTLGETLLANKNKRKTNIGRNTNRGTRENAEGMTQMVR